MIVFNFPFRLSAIAALALAIGFLSSSSHQASASEETEDSLMKLGPWAGDLVVGPTMNAVGKNLKGSEFIGQDLRSAMFDDCDLDKVVFYQCNLSSASFKHACLTGMNITDCLIEGADFTDATINGIVGMSGGLTDPRHSGWPHDMRLSVEQLMSTRSYKTKNLGKCVIYFSRGQNAGIPRYDFRGANLEGASLRDGDCRGCNFTNARIDGISMIHCTIDFKQLASTDNFNNRRVLRGARFSTMPFTGKWDLSGIDLTGTREFPAFIDPQVSNAIST